MLTSLPLFSPCQRPREESPMAALVRVRLQRVKCPLQYISCCPASLLRASYSVRRSASYSTNRRSPPANSYTSPLVQTKASKSGPLLTPTEPPPKPTKTAKGAFAPYLRISLGVIFCGSILYNMVARPLDYSRAPGSPMCMPVHLPPPA